MVLPTLYRSPGCPSWWVEKVSQTQILQMMNYAMDFPIGNCKY